MLKKRKFDNPDLVEETSDQSYIKVSVTLLLITLITYLLSKYEFAQQVHLAALQS